MKGSFWGYVIGYVGLPLLVIWGTHKLVMWALLSIHVPLWWADKAAILAALGAIVFMVVLRFKGKKGPAIGQVSQTTKTGKKVEDYVYRLVTTKGYLFLTNPFAGILVIGGAGAGKSFSVIEPIIVQTIEQGHAGLLYDFKFPTLAKIAQGAMKRFPSDTKSYIVNFDDLTRSHRVNPIKPETLHTASNARAAAQTIIKNLFPPGKGGDNFFVKNATTYLTGIIWFLKKEHPELCTLPHAMAMANEPVSKVVALLRENREVAGTIASIRTAVDEKAGGQIAAVVATLQDALSILNTPEIAWVLSGDDFDLNLNNPKSPKFVTIGNNPRLAGTYSPVIALIATMALGEMNQQGKIPSAVILDEAPTLYIPDFATIPATARSNKVATVFGAQDFSQIVSMYGQDEKDTIIANMANKFYGRVNHQQTAQYICTMWGKEQVLQRSESTSDASEQSMKTYQKSHQVSITDRDRVTIQQVLELQTGEFFGQLVESDVSYFRAKMKPDQADPVDLKAISQVDKNDIDSNFDRIQIDIENLFKPLKPIAIEPKEEVLPPAPEPAKNTKKHNLEDEF
ncbi:type IV secretory system conjugative DNA transfer family protein [Spirosoma aerophilum]